tara:strand:- start:186 stop:698 length:513 start_codon:yes stop_codon:yes gene_type:complete
MVLTISVRLSEKIDTQLREQAIKENTNISNIVNDVLGKYYDKYKYLDSINAHHLDPVVVSAFFLLVDSPAKMESMAEAGYKMIKKYISFHNNIDETLDTELHLLTKFLTNNSIKIKKDKKNGQIRYTGIHEFPVLYSKLLVRIIEKLLLQKKISNQSTVNDGTFTVIIKN